MDKRDLKRQYREEKRPAGVFQIRNLEDEKIFVVAGRDLPSLVNRHRFQLEAGGHPNKRLQADWNALGADRFAFETLDTLGDDVKDVSGELAMLEEIWLEDLRPFGERGYNEPKRGREERLRTIGQNRRGDV